MYTVYKNINYRFRQKKPNLIFPHGQNMTPGFHYYIIIRRICHVQTRQKGLNIYFLKDGQDETKKNI